VVDVNSEEAPSEVLVRTGEVLPATCVLSHGHGIIRSRFLVRTSMV
jgi:hypothetical protein